MFEFDSTHIWALVIGTIAVGRVARLLVYDKFPPILWLRLRFLVMVGDSGWKELVRCSFCMAPWIAAGDMAWAWASDLHWTWWAFNLWMAVSYLAAILVAYDQPEE